MLQKRLVGALVITLNASKLDWIVCKWCGCGRVGMGCRVAEGTICVVAHYICSGAASKARTIMHTAICGSAELIAGLKQLLW